MAIICRTAAKREQIRAATISALGSQVADKVRSFAPEEFIDFLKALPLPAAPTPSPPEAPKVKNIHGYKVKTTYARLSEEEQKSLNDQTIRSVIEMARKKRK